MKEVYLWKVEDKVIFHTDKTAAEQIDGLSRAPDKTVTEAEFSAAEGLARVIDDEIVIGKTEAEKRADEKQERIAEIQSRFVEIDQLDGPRSLREAVRDLADTAGHDTTYLMRHEAEANELREELAKLQQSA